MEKSVREILYDALRDLTEEQFKDFKWKLSEYHQEGKGTIAWGWLETADKTVTINLLYGRYGDDDTTTAVFLEVLGRINARNVVETLQSALDLNPTPGVTAEGYKLEYRNYLKEKFQTMKDLNSLPGEFVLLKERYSKLIILDHHRPEKEREHEILASGRKHNEIMGNRDSCSITIQTLFQPDKSGLIPNTVVLQGAAGIGKTMTARKIMLDWASGDLYPDLFDFIFYIHCRGMNLGREEKSLADVILTQWVNKGAIKGMLKNPQKLLFVIDGFDELRFSIDQPEDCLCSDPWKKASMSVLLNSLFRRKLLPESYLIITTRPTALEKLRLLLGRSRYAEILGFSPNDRIEYFHRFFQNKDQAGKALQVLFQNETLFTICFIPIVCWIICTVMKQQLDRGENLLQTSNTITAVYMLYLSSFLKTSQSDGKKLLQTKLRCLCSLAADGIWKQKILFGEEEILMYGLDQEDSLPLFLNENIFKRDIECICSYSFIHLSFQEFFAALSYLLEEEKGSLPPDRDVETLLEKHKSSRLDLALTVRFLFGLLNEEQRMRNLKEKFGWKISPRIKKLLLQWVKNTIETKMSLYFPSDHKADVLQLLYETQDEDFLKSSLDHVMEVSLQTFDITDMDAVIASFCLKNCHNLKVLSVSSIITERKHFQHFCEAVMYGCKKLEEIRDLCTILKTSQTLRELRLADNSYLGKQGIQMLYEALNYPFCQLQNLGLEEVTLTTSGCQHLVSVLTTSRTLKKLKVLISRLGDAGVKLLCEALKQPDCQLQTLMLWDCDLTSACGNDFCNFLGSSCSPILRELMLAWKSSLRKQGVEVKHPFCHLQNLGLEEGTLTTVGWQHLASVLTTSRTLKKLNLEYNKLGDAGVKLLCEGLKHPDCQLQTLMLGTCGLTAACCGDLSSVFRSNSTLIKLNLEYNVLEDSGVQLLCEGLKQPHCQLQILGLAHCSLTEGCCGPLSSLLATSQSLKELDVAYNRLGNEGVKLLCEGLKHSHCRLQKLNLLNCYLSADSCKYLIPVLRNGMMSELILGSNEFGKCEMKRMCKGLKYPPLKLWMRNSKYTTASCKDLCSVQSTSQNLKEIVLEENELGDEGVRLLCKEIRHPSCRLRKIRLNTYKLTDETVEELISLKRIKPDFSIDIKRSNVGEDRNG